MDKIGWTIATLHSLLGHEKAAAVLGVPVGDPAGCLICRYERTLDDGDRRAVIEALSPGGAG